MPPGVSLWSRVVIYCSTIGRTLTEGRDLREAESVLHPWFFPTVSHQGTVRSPFQF